MIKDINEFAESIIGRSIVIICDNELKAKHIISYFGYEQYFDEIEECDFENFAILLNNDNTTSYGTLSYCINNDYEYIEYDDFINVDFYVIDNVAIHMRKESKIIHDKLYEKYHIDIIL